MKIASRSRSSHPGQYPVATIAAYGPDNRLATKLVVSVLKRPGQRDPSAMHTWTTQAVDVRHDPEIAAEVASFLQRNGAKQTVAPDRVIGCPHEEGIDYPMGRTCPRCPFWAGIDRLTHEPVTPTVPTMTPAEILADLSTDGTERPREALESADGHRPLLVEPLLRALECGLADPADASPEEKTLFCYALYLLAKWREPRAYPYVVRWLSLPGEAPFHLAGDIVMQDGPRILAAVCDGDLEPIKALVVDRRANEYGRSAGVTALALLAAWAEVPRESIITAFLWLAQEGLEREHSQVWNCLAAESADIEALELFPELRGAYDDGLVEPQFMHPHELDQVEAARRGSVLEETRERHLPIDDVVDATAWWSHIDDVPESAVATKSVVAVQPYRAPPKTGRNEPCPCGSGKKFKKCCGG